MKESKHIVFYKDIPIAEYTSERDLRTYDPAEIYINNIDDFDTVEDVQALLNILLSNLYDFFKGNLPSGIRYQVLTEQAQSVDVLKLAPKLDEFSADISIDMSDKRRYEPVPDGIRSAAQLKSLIPPTEFEFAASERGLGERPSAMAGFFDKFTAVLEQTPSGPVLRPTDWKNEVGNVIVKVQGEKFPLIAVNEAFCLGLAEKCGLDVTRRWTITAGTDFMTRKQFITERFGVSATKDGKVRRDMVFDTGILLADQVPDQYTISSEKYFAFLKSILPEIDIQKMLSAYLFGYIVGNSDMHVKNFSVRYTGDGFRLMPIYDMVSYKAYLFKNDLALTVGGNTVVPEEKFIKFLLDQGMSPSAIRNMADDAAGGLDEAAKEYIDLNDGNEAGLFMRIKNFTESRCLAINAALMKLHQTIDNDSTDRGCGADSCGRMER